ncbi:MAG: selenium-dependent xanthine dehydrogenase [Negativicutes bacterium]
MAQFTVNGQMITTEEDENLLEYLRETLRLTSMKNGCGEGACGACMVLINGLAMRACLQTLARVDGKTVLTVEGLSEREKQVYTWAFAEAGAVQCGFCTPGMVISAKALLDKDPESSAARIKEALRGNICRCTGYVKIEKAILMAASALRGETVVPAAVGCGVGERASRIDAAEKILGTGEYVDDMKVPGMLYAAVLRTPLARARILSIDAKAARSLEGVTAVMTAADIPGERLWGHLKHDWPAMIAIGEETRYIGDSLAIVAARTKKIARKAVEMIRLEYEELPPILSPQAAMAADAPPLHPGGNILSKVDFSRGDAQAAIQTAAHVVTRSYQTPPTEHAFLEPESALAVPDENGKITVYIASQSVFDDHHGIAAILGLPADRVRVVSKLVGGAFGGKEDLSVQHHAALLAQKTGQPVKLTLTRQESIRVHPKRHAMELTLTTACDEAGKLVAMKARIVADTGAYASLGGPVVQRACTHVSGPYSIPNVEISGVAVYTNNPPAGAFRGFGVPQSNFASEMNLNLLADLTGLSPWEIRFLNALEPGAVMATGQIADASTAIKETLLAVKEEYETAKVAGIACAMKNTGLGVGVPDTGRAILRIRQGKVEILTGAACVGQGLGTVLRQIVCETAPVRADDVTLHAPDTDVTPNAGTTTASRQTLFTGEAVRQAAITLREAMKSASLAELDGQEFAGQYRGETDPLNSDKPHPVNHVAFGYATQVVCLSESGWLRKVVAAHDVGRAINPTTIEGQIEGAVAMGLGYALQEDFPLKRGVPTAKFGTLGLFRSTDMPEIKIQLIEKNPSALAYGAKGIGEIATIPTAPAVAGAYYRYDKIFRTQLPLANTKYSNNY